MSATELSTRSKADCRGFVLHRVRGGHSGWFLYRNQELVFSSYSLESVNRYLDEVMVEAVRGLPMSPAFKEALELLRH